jgi:hypothetical protein
MFTRKSGILALVVGALALGACEDDENIVTPPPAPTIQIAPASVSLEVGQTVQLVAVTTNQPAGTTVQFSSSNPAVATVNATTGVVTCVSEGVATIIASISGQNPPVQTAAAVTCSDEGTDPPPGQVVISIQSITDNDTGLPVNPGDVSGVITIRANVDVPAGVAVSSFRVSLGDVVACTQTFTGSGAAPEATAAAVPVTVECSVNTAQVDANGNPLYPNGPTAVVVEAINPQGTSIASASTNIVLDNENTLQIEAEASGASANDPEGLVWHEGDLTVTVRPAIFEGDAEVTSVTITVEDLFTGEEISQTVSTPGAEGQFVATFSEEDDEGDDGVDNFEGPIQVRVTSVVSGNAGPSAQTSADPDEAILRLDNLEPETGDAELVDMEWYGTNTEISEDVLMTDADDIEDDGVNDVSIIFQYNEDTGADLDEEEGWVTFDSPEDLPDDSATPDAFVVRALVCDALMNCVPVGDAGGDPDEAGADLTAPEVTDIVEPEDSIFEMGDGDGAEFTVVAEESQSGFEDAGTTFLSVRIIRYTDGQIDCVDPNDLSDAQTDVDDAEDCEYIMLEMTSTVDLDGAGDGFYEVSAFAVDRASNQSEDEITAEFLIDTEAPAVSATSLSFTASTATVGGEVTDNLDIKGYDTRLAYSGGLRLPYTDMSETGTFGLPLTTEEDASGTADDIIFSITDFTGNVAGATQTVTEAGFGALDVATHFTFDGLGFAPDAGDAAFDNLGVVNTLDLETEEDALCRSDNDNCEEDAVGAGDPADDIDATESTLTAVLNTDPDTQNPAARAVFFANVTAPNGETYQIRVGEDTSATLSIVSGGDNSRNWTYTTELSVDQLPPVVEPGTAYDVTLFVVLVDAEGNAISTSQLAGPAVRVY